jgi:hypothetical protein
MNKEKDYDYLKVSIKHFAKIYGVKRKDVKSTVKDLNKFSKKKRSIGKVISFIEARGFEKNTAYKLTGLLQGSSKYLIDSTTQVFHYRGNDPKLYDKIRHQNWMIRLGESEIRRRKARRGSRDGIGIYDYRNQKCEWKDLSELPDHNNGGSVIGTILVAGIWHEEDGYQTHYIGYLTGSRHPEVVFTRPGRSTQPLSPEYVSKIEKWMEIPEYKSYER